MEIRHTVVFKLIHLKGSAAEATFLAKANQLSDIKGVQNFECLLQVSPKNHFDYGLSMEFSSQADYDFYNQHPEHQKFVQQVWLKEVDDFLEIDFKLP